LRHEQTLQRQRIGALERELAALNPRATLARGYALIEGDHDGRPLTTTTAAQPGRDLRVTVADGTFGVVVTTAGTPTPSKRTRRGTSRSDGADR
jgi:exonuclease VII large subunit